MVTAARCLIDQKTTNSQKPTKKPKWPAFQHERTVFIYRCHIWYHSSKCWSCVGFNTLCKCIVFRPNSAFVFVHEHRNGHFIFSMSRHNISMVHWTGEHHGSCCHVFACEKDIFACGSMFGAAWATHEVVFTRLAWLNVCVVNDMFYAPQDQPLYYVRQM